MEKIKFISASEEETVTFGKELVKDLRGGDIICLHGDLGAGKTTLVKGLAEGLGIKPEEVNSPTFVVMNVYEGRKLPLYHFDLYRLETKEALRSVEYDEFFYGEGISVVEWAERLGEMMPPNYIKIELSHLKENKRAIIVSLKGNRKK